MPWVVAPATPGFIAHTCNHCGVAVTNPCNTYGSFSSSGLPSVAPPTVLPSPRPDVNPPSAGTFLLYAQGQQIGYLPLNGTRLKKEAAKILLSLHVKYFSAQWEKWGTGAVLFIYFKPKA